MNPMLIAAGVSGAASILGNLFGKQKAPQVAQYPQLDIAKASQDAINANMANSAAAQKLSTQTNTYNQNEANRLMETAMPGYSKLRDKLMSQVNTTLDNQYTMPKEMQAQLERYGAEKGLTRGTAGGVNSMSLIKDFGINLMDWQQAQRAAALNTLSTVYGMAPRVNPMSPMSMFVDANTAVNAQAQNNQNQFNSQQAAYNAQAAASNANSAMWGNTFNQIGGMVGSYYMLKGLGFGNTPGGKTG